MHELTLQRLSQGGRSVPISVKGVLTDGDRVLLLRQQSGRWELPGGKVEGRETLFTTLRREFREETGLSVTAGPLLDTWMRVKPDGSRRFVISLRCQADGALGPLRLSEEHREADFFSLSAALALDMLEGYRRAVRTALERPVSRPAPPQHLAF